MLQLSPIFHLLHLGLITIFILPVSSIAVDVRHTACSHPFECGDFHNISYPFWGDPLPPYCGLSEFQLACQDGFPVLHIMSERFRVLLIDHEKHILRLARLDLYDNNCPSRYVNTTLSYLFSYAPDFGNLTLFYGCSSVTPPLASNTFSCRKNDSSTETGFYTIGSIPSGENNRTCNESITVPVLQTAAKALRDNVSSLTEALDDGFEVQWIVDRTACLECVSSGGRCGYNTSYFHPICFCPDQPYTLRCPKGTDTLPFFRVKVHV
ncbi:LEAF RUST 10 DISEASE-RESISTANCE LOCUS RECEPTOR-LIKE PROTEIN KINASE-like 2.7 [Corylus avellana]|uniref:LEAF RUST 10 DISEASE-RESISTANCE LOCUS RECEPTOR-LIKE PROTEIN KINASE-like 2.7 n=1 Tax=Corylus avellana TaxID=13451 RepID=UPI00286B59A1|nr:LEAF RUST 10 DISEASE-RESISTANCE LOCUS RECEPTOR-LIKE PROTEIN KINASE-like 2.7 [Corylus avellana]